MRGVRDRKVETRAMTWKEMDTMPEEMCREDAEITATQWRELRSKFIQIEIETDVLLEATADKTENGRRWQEVKTTMQALCQEAYQQVEWTRRTLKEMREKDRVS